MASTAQGPKAGNVPATELVRCETAEEAIDHLVALYDAAIAQIESDFEAFAKGAGVYFSTFLDPDAQAAIELTHIL